MCPAQNLADYPFLGTLTRHRGGWGRRCAPPGEFWCHTQPSGPGEVFRSGPPSPRRGSTSACSPGAPHGWSCCCSTARGRPGRPEWPAPLKPARRRPCGEEGVAAAAAEGLPGSSTHREPAEPVAGRRVMAGRASTHGVTGRDVPSRDEVSQAGGGRHQRLRLRARVGVRRRAPCPRTRARRVRDRLTRRFVNPRLHGLLP
jgi:hypothetical protein